MDMIICPNCGASNKPGASVCRMCAVPMPDVPQYPGNQQYAGNPPSQPAPFPPTIIASEQNYNAGFGASNSGETECPKCHTMNEAGWSFCQQCGSRLPQGVPSQPAPPQPAPPQPGPPQMETMPGFKTVPTEVPSIDHGFKTVVADRPRTEPVGPPPSAPNSSPHVPPPNPPHMPQQGLPTVAEAIPPRQPDYRQDLATVVAQPPVINNPQPPMQQPPQPTPPMPQPAVQPPPARVEQPQPPAASASSGAVCPKCNHPNTAGSSFCANCGTVLTVARTIVMASPLAVPRGRLHLVMEGGQQGEVFELSDETVVGRNSGDITFPHDGFMSGQHARIEQRNGNYVLTDIGSRNGTFIKIKGEVELKPGDMILIGKQLFRFEI